MPEPNPYQRGLDKNAANYAPLSPISLIARTADTYPRHVAVVHGDRRMTWEETYARSRRLASALVRAGIRPGETVAVKLLSAAADATVASEVHTRTAITRRTAVLARDADRRITRISPPRR